MMILSHAKLMSSALLGNLHFTNEFLNKTGTGFTCYNTNNERLHIQDHRKQIEKANYAILNRVYLFKEVTAGDSL